LGITLENPKSDAERQTLVDKIRALKSKPGKAYDAVLGVPVAIWDGGMELLAKSIEGGIAVKDAVEKTITYIKDNWDKKFGKFNEQKIRDYFVNNKPKNFLPIIKVLGNTCLMKKMLIT